LQQALKNIVLHTIFLILLDVKQGSCEHQLFKSFGLTSTRNRTHQKSRICPERGNGHTLSIIRASKSIVKRPSIKEVCSQGESLFSADKGGSSDANVRTFWCKRLGFFEI